MEIRIALTDFLCCTKEIAGRIDREKFTYCKKPTSSMWLLRQDDAERSHTNMLPKLHFQDDAGNVTETMQGKDPNAARYR